MFGWFTTLLKVARGPRKVLGNRGEIEAAKFLEGLGYKIIHRQWRERFGEIDLIAIDHETIVFVEVKTRASTNAGHPTEAITTTKQGRMTRAALAFLKRKRWLNRRSRFDVIAVIWPSNGDSPQLQHYINAFEPSGFGQLYS